MKILLALLVSVFSLLDLKQPGLERVKDAYESGDEVAATAELLHYYKTRELGYPGVELVNTTISEQEQKWADDALEHRFFVHHGYQPSYFYGKDIDWTYWPVKDNELRWQLHRHKWFTPMGKAWRVSGDEKYVREWMSEYRDWIRKNPLVPIDAEEFEIRYQGHLGELKENVRFAWRPLEVSHRVEDQIRQFALMVDADCFDGQFLLDFLSNYYTHADYLQAHYSEKGNHLLFEAQRMLAASFFFHEFKDAGKWRDDAVAILGREIGLQVYDDGVQYELDPHYHIEAAKLFYNALSLCSYYGMLDVFPQSYLDTVHKMIEVSYNLVFPDYTVPVFSDCRFLAKDDLQAKFSSWADVYADDGYLKYLATDGEDGNVPEYLCKAFKTGGFYILRSSWDMNATQVDIKAGPKAFWHCQPDNGTFEYWSRGRNFFPDSGSYVYGGNDEILSERNWFRQTRVHNTVTLDDRNLDSTASRLLNWSARRRKVTVVNDSYEGFTHKRTFNLCRSGKLVIRDEITGDATGVVGVHFNLVPSEVAVDTSAHVIQVCTLFEDDNNISISTRSREPLTYREDEGWCSLRYREKEQRPAYTVQVSKATAKKVVLKTVIQ